MKALLLLLLVLGGPLQAQDIWRQQVDSSLSRASAMAAKRGYLATGQWVTGELFADESVRREVSLSAGGSYMLVGVCDTDCRSLGLALATPNGDDLAADSHGGNVPLIEAVATRSGAYLLRVRMGGCRVSPCRYGVAVFRKR
jgi:hypothetical protein